MHIIPSGAKYIFSKIAQMKHPRKSRKNRRLFTPVVWGALFVLCATAAQLCNAVNESASREWQRGWAAWRSGAPTQALECWDANPALSPFYTRFPKFYYWRIRALEKEGHHERASQLASILALRSPLSFYSLVLSYDGRYPQLSAAVRAAARSSAYPRKWEKEVLAASSATGLSKNILWAVILQESKFNADAVSRSGAVGLMQLMPFTAKEAAARLKDESLTPYTPTHNVMLGAAHLLHLKNHFNGNLPLAVAAYNAGASAVSRWQPTASCEWVEWIESIPYVQTREYVKSVLANIEVYAESSPCAEDGGSFFRHAEEKPDFTRRSAQNTRREIITEGRNR